MDPTPAEIAAMTTLDAIFAWNNLEGDMGDVTTQAGSLAQLIGASGTMHPRFLSTVKIEEIRAVVANWRIPAEDGRDRAPTLVETGKAMLVLRCCHLVGGQGQSIDELHAALAKATARPPSVPSSPAASSGDRKVKLNAVTSQVDDTEINLLTETDLVNMYLEYEKVYGKGERPPKDAEPTGEQLAAIVHLLKVGMPPYADFAIFGPYGRRIERKVKLSGMTLGRDGVIRQIEMQGPPNIASWILSYNVLMTILVMAKAVDLGILMKYRSHIERLHDRYSHRIWAILYQAESRCRLEFMDRVKRELAAEHEEATRNGTTTPFDPARPWNLAWQRAVSDESFWREEVIEPGMLILTKVAGLNDVIDGDARIQNTGTLPSAPREPPTAPARMSSSSQPVRPRNANRTGRFHQIENGRYVLNRTGYKLCEGYQTGECNQTTGGVWCAHQWDTTHQCNKCLGNHQAMSCPNKDKEITAPACVRNQGKSGKGSQKGKGKQKIGKRAPY